jgi:hypothetical protein
MHEIMPRELHRLIVQAALQYFASRSDVEIAGALGFPISYSLVRWCADNPEWKDDVSSDTLELLRSYRLPSQKERL